MTKLFRALAVLVTLAVIFLTLGPVGIRAMSPIDARWDRALAFAVIGGLAVLSAPRRPWLSFLLVVGIVGGLEVLQQVMPDRHGRLIDVAEKLAGATVGAALGYVVLLLISRRRRASAG